MENFNSQDTRQDRQSKQFRIDEADLPAVFGGAALLFVAGFMIGSGRLDILARAGGRILSDVGLLVLESMIDSIRHRQAEFVS